VRRCGVYRYRELRSGGTETFVLNRCCRTGYDVHISKLRLRNVEASMKPPRRYHRRSIADKDEGCSGTNAPCPSLDSSLSQGWKPQNSILECAMRLTSLSHGASHERDESNGEEKMERR